MQSSQLYLKIVNEILLIGMHGVLKDGFGLAAKNFIGYAKVSTITPIE
jgi:hypothetical protein